MLNCKFITNGISIQQDQVLRPCCTWQFNDDWAKNNYASTVDIANWHNSTDVLSKKQMLDNDQWPDNCQSCSRRELAGNYNNMRSNGNSAYSDYSSEDITLEIRPGSVCNLACQTCWPEASSRVANYQLRAKIIDKRPQDINIQNFDFLKPIAHRIRDVVLLGGEPFYDKNCRNFLEWSEKNLNATQMIFTNGVVVDYNFLKNYKGKIILIFSMDAAGKSAEYVRMGTVWEQVWKNYQQCKKLDNVEVRVNVTTSVYNYVYMKPLLELLSTNWPDLITFGSVNQEYLQPKTIPYANRQIVIGSLKGIDEIVDVLSIPDHQKQHVKSTVQVIVSELENKEFDESAYSYLKNYISSLDRVKNLCIKDFCPEIVEYLSLNN